LRVNEDIEFQIVGLQADFEILALKEPTDLANREENTDIVLSPKGIKLTCDRVKAAGKSNEKKFEIEATKPFRETTICKLRPEPIATKHRTELIESHRVC
jgi:hypothetical protein